MSEMASAMAVEASGGSSVYPEDIVKFRLDGVEKHAVVTRCWADEVSSELVAQAHLQGIDYKPLDSGQLEVLLPGGQQIVIMEVDAQVVDRGFLVGDLCRKAGGKGQAGTIVNIKTEIQIMHTLEQEQLPAWYNADSFVGAIAVTRGDHVVHGDWVGIVEETLEIGLVEMSRAGGVPDLRHVCDIGSASKLSVGASSANFFLDTPITSSLSGSTDRQKIIGIKQMLFAVNWLCTNQRGDVSNFERPQRLWVDITDLKPVRTAADHLHAVGDNVKLRKEALAQYPEVAALSRRTGHLDGSRVFTITRTRSTITVLWQDGSTTVGPSHEYEHCINIDEEVDAFPGDIGMFTATDPPRVAVVQSMQSKKRVLNLRWYEDGPQGQVETVSGLDFDQHGPPPEVYGVRRQDVVLVTKEGTTNGHAIPTVPRLGESEVATGNFPEMNLLRVQMGQIGLELAQRFTYEGRDTFELSKESLKSINWYGIVSDLQLDGRVVLQYPSGERETLPLDRLYLLDDGLGPDGHQHDEDGMSFEGGSEDSWRTDSDAGAAETKDGQDWAADQESEDLTGAVGPQPEKSHGWAEESKVTDTAAQVSMPAELEDDENWKRFEVLEGAPESHHYYTQAPTRPSKAYMSRIAKEHAVLASSLPPNILVRAYEDRSDLLRCLIIGPIGTPFANAPFLFDIYLSPTRFPVEPPQVFFHSWCGNTRVSPNLYAEGKVCLSLLNTWEGDATESWSAGRSSILQVVVSIQGLIMTENPYYTEPGFEKQMGSNEGEAASDMYNERTFVLTRAFVLRAVTSTPAQDFKNEIQAYYRTGLVTTGPGALQSIIEQAQRLLTESTEYHQREDELEDEAAPNGVKSTRKSPSKVVPGLTVLTEGAALSLKRTLASLEGVL